MNRARELSFVWALADWAVEYMRPDARVRLCTKIGAGEQDSAIADLLAFYSNSQVELPYELAAPIREWIQGYAGTVREPVLLRLYDRIRVSIITQTIPSALSHHRSLPESSSATTSPTPACK